MREHWRSPSSSSGGFTRCDALGLRVRPRFGALCGLSSGSASRPRDGPGYQSRNEGTNVPAYYNENDPNAVQALRGLIAGGHIAPGDVDERSIVDVRADDLRG